ncbi:hypothetical protein ACTHQ6_16910 [Arthrobacter sp. SAFR-179]|uniref:hypothetical protein n=1 Tax=Arthrobacter sp. SAFR-179 TaxID=3387279 RepID=UPI003F7C82F1
MYEEVCTGLLHIRFPEDRIIPTITAPEAFIFGSAFDVNAPERIFNSGTLATMPRTSQQPLPSVTLVAPMNRSQIPYFDSI